MLTVNPWLYCIYVCWQRDTVLAVRNGGLRSPPAFVLHCRSQVDHRGVAAVTHSILVCLSSAPGFFRTSCGWIRPLSLGSIGRCRAGQLTCRLCGSRLKTWEKCMVTGRQYSVGTTTMHKTRYFGRNPALFLGLFLDSCNHSSPSPVHLPYQQAWGSSRDAMISNWHMMRSKRVAGHRRPGVVTP